MGCIRVYEFNPRYALKDEVSALLNKSLTQLPPVVQERLTLQRKRPRRTAKPLWVFSSTSSDEPGWQR